MAIQKQEQFIKHEPTENNNKSWRYEIHDDGSIHVFWGRIGQTEQSQVIYDKWVLNKRINDKLSNGYRQIALHVPTAGPVVPGISPNTKEQKFVEWVFAAANVSIGSFLTGAVNALSVDQLNKARAILKAWRVPPHLGSHHLMSNEQLVAEYYRTIPTKLPARIKLAELVADFNPSDQENRLNQLEANLASYTPQGTQVQTGIFDTQLKLAEGPTLDTILGQYQKAQVHGKKIPTPLYVLQTRIPKEREAYEAHPAPNPQILFHGTNAAFLLHILRSGLRRPTHAANGWRLGPGIYFAEDPARSYNYLERYQSQKAMLICEVKVGKSHNESGSHKYQQPPAGYHSVRGTHSNSGIDEITIYDASQVTVRGVMVYSA